MRIAYFGGSFNPPHYGHFLVSAWALCGGFVDRVWMAPCYEHAFGKQLVPYAERVEMCRIGAALFSDKVEVSTIEQELGGPSYTIDVMEAVTERHADDQFFLLVGTDILNEKEHWKSFDKLISLAPLLVAPRGGFHTEQNGFHIPEVASSQIRTSLAKNEDVSAIVPPPILDFIKQNQLYEQANQ